MAGDTTVVIQVANLIALYQVLVDASTQLEDAEAELRRLAEEEFVSVRYRCSPAKPRTLRAVTVEIAGWIRDVKPETPGVQEHDHG